MTGWSCRAEFRNINFFIARIALCSAHLKLNLGIEKGNSLGGLRGLNEHKNTQKKLKKTKINSKKPEKAQKNKKGLRLNQMVDKKRSPMLKVCCVRGMVFSDRFV